MAMDMRALYYIMLPIEEQKADRRTFFETAKANENCLNQNFTILTQKLEELESRLSGVESGS